MVAAPSGPSTEHDPGPHGVDPDGPAANEEPSVEWGWHGTFPRATRIAGWFTAASMFFMLIGNHESNVENWWLLALGAGLALLLLGKRLSRSPWRR